MADHPSDHRKEPPRTGEPNLAARRGSTPSPRERAAQFAVLIDRLQREDFYSEKVNEAIFEGVEDYPGVIRILTQVAVNMATMPDGLWSSQTREFVEAVENILHDEENG